MATSPKAVFLFASTLCFMSLIGLAHSGKTEDFSVVGKIYCDNCRIQFVTRISTYISGARVRLECKERESEQLTYSAEGETDDTGTYHIKVEGDHEEEVCEIALVNSPDPDCKDIDKKNFLSKSSARISLAKDSGITSDIRLANPLGFMTKDRLPECSEVLKELGISDSETSDSETE